MSFTRSALAVVATGLMLTGQACRSEPPRKLFAGGPLPIGQDIYLSPANYGWSFSAKPGETYRIAADWPKANVNLMVGSDHRGAARDEEDDAEHQATSKGAPAGEHGQQATLVVGPQADTVFIELHTVGIAPGPIHLRIERGP